MALQLYGSKPNETFRCAETVWACIFVFFFSLTMLGLRSSLLLLLLLLSLLSSSLAGS